MNVVLLNDTYHWYHWGCTATSRAISRHVQAAGHHCEYVSIMTINRMQNPLETLDDFDDPAHLEKAIINNPELFSKIDAADLVLINGEGTLHHLSEPVVNLLYLAYVSKTALSKQVQIINHSPYPEAYDDPALLSFVQAMYLKTYSWMDYIAIREHRAQHAMNQLGISSALAFDCLPLTIREEFPELANTDKQDTILFTNAVNMPDKQQKAMLKIMKQLVKTGFTVRVLYGAKDNGAVDEERYIERLQASRLAGVEFCHATTLEQWLSEIASARLLVSGRFHHSIAAAFLKTPFVLLASNTQKNRALAESLSLPAPISYDMNNFSERVTKRIRQSVETVQQVPDDILDALHQRALLNFSQL
ncbi:MAG: polysaccharide pyruvyl transferase family protein [Gammaproteobacteria bacterium]